MIEKSILIFTLCLFILAFAWRNAKTSKATGLSIKGKSKKLSLSILLSTSIYLFLFYRLLISGSDQLPELDLTGMIWLKWIGVTFVIIGFFLGLASLWEMRNSWRVGIQHDQKTELVTSGIFNYSRNPYFLSWYIFFGGFLCIYPSPILFVLYVSLVYTFHRMILEEEKYLTNVHTADYTVYKSNVRRYI